MKTKQFSKTANKFKALQDLAVIFATGNKSNIIQAVNSALNNPLFDSIGWKTNLNKLLQSVVIDYPEFAVFALNGNSKLPFVSFSVLPGVTCPGAGDCLDYCYSYRAWRYPAAFARQAQNTYLVRFNKAAIINQLNAINQLQEYSNGYDLRLYVDGDFDSVETVKFWFDTLKVNPKIRAYGYSKSFEQIRDYYNKGLGFPDNYQLNLSGGHCHGESLVNELKQYSITRGEFIAVNIGRTVTSDMHGKPDTNKAIREVMALQGVNKVFPCPGSCGTCTGSGHACGLPKLKGVTIAIAIH